MNRMNRNAEKELYKDDKMYVTIDWVRDGLIVVKRKAGKFVFRKSVSLFGSDEANRFNICINDYASFFISFDKWDLELDDVEFHQIHPSGTFCSVAIGSPSGGYVGQLISNMSDWFHSENGENWFVLHIRIHSPQWKNICHSRGRAVSARLKHPNWSDDHLKKIISNPNLFDIVFEVDGKQIHASKFLMALHSDVFANMLDHDWKESKNARIEITDIEYNTMSIFVNLINGDDVVLREPDSICKLAVVADKYNVQLVKELCDEKLAEHLTLLTVATVLPFAELLGLERAKRACVAMIVENVKSDGGITKIPNYDQLSVPSFVEIINIISGCKMATQIKP